MAEDVTQSHTSSIRRSVPAGPAREPDTEATLFDRRLHDNTAIDVAKSVERHRSTRDGRTLLELLDASYAEPRHAGDCTVTDASTRQFRIGCGYQWIPCDRTAFQVLPDVPMVGRSRQRSARQMRSRIRRPPR
jgi:hypothetical protein